MPTAMEMTNPLNPPAPSPPSARFTLELEFVLSLSNPHYLSHLASVYPHLLNPPASNSTSSPTGGSDSDASRFAAEPGAVAAGPLPERHYSPRRHREAPGGWCE